ncbi:MAG: protein-L-isoaspartate(D-aspartate) O-methyltransferase [Gemmatimonadetes bacterium]|nr:protein-L-isoaspartate(D-aspartate) O-methyltransferase [Gemmatimonadota bacterium]
MGSEPVGDHRFAGARGRLIERIRAMGVEDLDILRLFDDTPRHLFLPEAMWPRAYLDSAVPIGFGQTASQPSLQAFYLSLLAPGREDKVLEIGTGSGFLTALLAGMAHRVYSIERVRDLSRRARRALDRIGVSNAALIVGDGTIGWRKYEPFEVIVVSAGSPSVPQALVDQLADGGRMLIPVGTKQGQELVMVRRTGGAVREEVVRDAVRFVPLKGEFGWREK